MAPRPYAIYDVFSEEPLAGNPLAVVFEAEGLEPDRMQAIAREFNLAETVFVLEPLHPLHRAALRIFTPKAELPFAGHPTIGAAIALAERDGHAGSAILVLEEKVGQVRAAVNLSRGAVPFAEFDLPRLPEPLAFAPDPGAVAAALSLVPQEIGFENHRITAYSAGIPFVLVPVADLAAAGRARIHADAWLSLLPEEIPAAPYLYCRECLRHDSGFHARMFMPWTGIPEDPATGAAVAALAGAIVRFDRPTDGLTTLRIEQGMEMGRPSCIRLEIEVGGGGILSARIGGSAVRVAEGLLSV